METSKHQKELNTDIMEALLTLQRMNDKLQNRENYTERLIEDGKKSMRNLANWNIEEGETRSYVRELIHLLNVSLDLNIELKRQKENLWKKHMERVGQKSF